MKIKKDGFEGIQMRMKKSEAWTMMMELHTLFRGSLAPANHVQHPRLFELVSYLDEFYPCSPDVVKNLKQFQNKNGDKNAKHT